MWSLQVHATINGAPFHDLTADDREAGPSGVVKDEDEEAADGGAAVKDEDFVVFDYKRCR